MRKNSCHFETMPDMEGRNSGMAFQTLSMMYSFTSLRTASGKCIRWPERTFFATSATDVLVYGSTP